MVSPVHIKEDGVMQAIIGKAYAMDSEKEEYIVSGGLLMYAGIKLNMRFIGTGLGEGSRVMGDHSSRLYTIDRVK
jgi:alpha-galactosidase